MAVQFESLNSVKGDRKIYIEDTTPEDRADLAATINPLLREGNALFLIQGDETRLIRGYDAETNEWIVASTPEPRPRKAREPQERLPNTGARVTAVGRRSGG